MKKISSLILVVFMMLTAFYSQPAAAQGGREALSSFLLPTTGQAMNGEVGTKKTAIMTGVEVASVGTLAFIGLATGGAAIWFGLGPLLANHTYSAVDAYKGAKYKSSPIVQDQMAEAQRTLELSRERRFEREQYDRSDIRDRIARAGQEAN